MAMLTTEQAWSALREVPDPELPVLSICELGIVRDVQATAGHVTVVVTPTYSGCPATEMIQSAIRDALNAAGASMVTIETRLSPAWTTDWIHPAAREKLRGHGVAPPNAGPAGDAQLLRFTPPAPECPRCGSRSTVRISEFGATACKALYRCESCREPFEYFKPL